MARFHEGLLLVKYSLGIFVFIVIFGNLAYFKGFDPVCFLFL